MRCERLFWQSAHRIVAYGFALALLLAAIGVPAQSLSGGNRWAPQFEAPLRLFVQGPGRVVPFRDGQLLPIGPTYRMTAEPLPGRTFAGWTPVAVFTIVDTVTNESGAVSTTTNTVVSPVVKSIPGSTLKFQVQAPEVIFDDPGVQTVIRSSGWQANFNGPD